MTEQAEPSSATAEPTGPDHTAHKTVNRRTMITALGVGVAGVAVGGGWYASRDSTKKLPTASVASWAASRGSRYFIAHRGSGDVFPEHTMPAYDAAFNWGAPAMEISTSSTSDGVLICMHDLTYNRTTNITGTINALPSQVLANARVMQPQLGPAWTKPPLLPRIPLLEDVLKKYGGHVVLSIEPKRDADYLAVIAMIEKYGLQSSVIIKLFHTSKQIAAAQAAGYPVFSYLGPSDVSADSITALAARLNPAKDYLVLPTTSTSAPTARYLPADLISAAAATKLSVLLYPVHRRSEAAHYFGLGAVGVVSSSVGYSMHAQKLRSSDSWGSDKIAAGEMTQQPALPADAPTWAGHGELTLRRRGSQQFLTLGQFCPLKNAQAHYRIQFQARWDELPADLTSPLTLAFGHFDDSYYQDGLSYTDGYGAVIRANGSLELHSHSPNGSTDQRLGSALTTSAAITGQWMTFCLEVTPETITWHRNESDPAILTVRDSRYRGGYIHIGRGSQNGSLSLRSLRVS